MLQVGPAKVIYRLFCDCRYEYEQRVLGRVTRESGFYRAEGGRIELYRPNGWVSWVYRVDPLQWVLEEQPGKLFTYFRKAPGDCP